MNKNTTIKEQSFRKTCDNAATGSKRKWTFLMSPSKLPKIIKDLQTLDKELLKGFQPLTTPYHNSDIRYDRLLDELSSIIHKDCGVHEWDLYSNFINTCYISKSTSCYISMRTIFKEDVTITANILYRILEEVHIDLNIKVYKDPLMFVSSWLARHLHRMIRNNHHGLRYHRSKKLYERIAKENKENENDLRTPTVSMLTRCIDGLIERGYAIGFKGFKNENFDKSKMSLLIPTNKLLSLIKVGDTLSDDDDIERLAKYVEVRDADKNPIPKELYKEEWLMDTERSAEILKKHSDLLYNSNITLDDSRLPDINLLRIHNDGDVDKGGRLFDDGTWTTMRKKDRKRVVIDGQPIITLDLKHLHPSLLYSREGIDITDFDPYGGVTLTLDTKMIRRFEKFYNISGYNPIRNVVKLALLILINSDSEKTAMQALERKIARDFAKGGTVLEDEMSYVGLPRRCAQSVIDQVKEHNKQISKYFCTGIAKELMRIDSDIILEALDTLTDEKICALPLHDSVSVQEAHQQRAREVMEESFNKVVGNLMNFKLEVE